jgi:hypothetical protein
MPEQKHGDPFHGKKHPGLNPGVFKSSLILRAKSLGICNDVSEQHPSR